MVNFKEDEQLNILNHSCAHLMAHAIKHLYPHAKFWVGPVVAEGFYYDVDLGDDVIRDEDITAIEKEMKKIAKTGKKIYRRELTKEEALEMFAGDEYKLELINNFEDGTVISCYEQGDFIDLCRGPHVDNVKMCRNFKLIKYSGAYWKGDSKNKMLQRIYGVCFETEEDLNAYLNELEEIVKKYKLKKKYHRLKNGSFLDLQESNEIDFIDKLISGTDTSYKELESGSIRLPVNRTLYLNQLLKEIKGTEIVKNKEYKNIIDGLDKDLIDEEEQIPEKLEAILRPYQKIGYKWLKTLDRYKFGGILADDMGLGKTIQIISILLDYKQNSDEHRASIVVSPSSLSLNWKNEIEKFAPSLNIKVVRGTVRERKEIIQNIDKYDLIITSYDLLKRDIDTYKEKNYSFKYMIADEAQYLKNNNTKNAKAIKQLNADTRYALTGTPIENSLAELWSIFDFVMPGYLFSYKEFKSTYETAIVKDEDKKTMDKLKMLIEPFVLRRTKKEVLTELPEKTITVLNNEMEEEQRNIYLSYLVQAKQELQDEINMNGYEKSQIKILAALTRLRQICCHPGLFIENYTGGSSKLEQCMEIIEDGVMAGHKILLFSSYTSMFEIIEKELNKRDIKYFKLTGATKVDERIELVDEFNHNPEIGVFLISLKAGGTGLNLIGADMVIHYDPWWNISAENQATDRAYRIGQKNNVQVYKLITKDTIEEKIYELQQKKAELTENMLSTQTTFINKLSKEDIMNLFN